MGVIPNLVNVCGQKVKPGLKTRAWVVCESDVLTVPDVIGGIVPGEGVVIGGDIILKPLAFWAEITILTDTGSLKTPMAGVIGSKSFADMLEFQLPYTGPAATQWVQERANSCFLCLVEEKDSGGGDYKRLLGNIGLPVIQEAAEADTGKTSEDAKAWNITWKNPTGDPALYYNGDIDVDPLT